MAVVKKAAVLHEQGELIVAAAFPLSPSVSPTRPVKRGGRQYTKRILLVQPTKTLFYHTLTMLLLYFLCSSTNLLQPFATLFMDFAVL